MEDRYSVGQESNKINLEFSNMKIYWVNNIHLIKVKFHCYSGDSIDTSYNPGNPVVNTELLLNGQESCKRKGLL